eukprot:CAMPEP_0177215222 /NCGR_PEP_ID=MMETSP0367-20130122/34104_1 /TAXON_ID=447022 ORGANISM="Scrippsiella hangoei-like, Strain SHHI-4" /NCGR_SAMPLE_ID=MMETSP0367 /ASSEMBLY_ACC=CAM_ASM_000362 /LENGTH=305 /DNA_ID=CAMNT_0018664647 /DNA_START=884 /DNA_END=1802 /DNA_ORIENTATION=+
MNVIDNTRSSPSCVHALTTDCTLKGDWQLLGRIHATCFGTVSDTPLLPNCEPLHGSKHPKRKQNANRRSKADGIQSPGAIDDRKNAQDEEERQPSEAMHLDGVAYTVFYIERKIFAEGKIIMQPKIELPLCTFISQAENSACVPKVCGLCALPIRQLEKEVATQAKVLVKVWIWTVGGSRIGRMFDPLQIQLLPFAHLSHTSADNSKNQEEIKCHREKEFDVNQLDEVLVPVTDSGKAWNVLTKISKPLMKEKMNRDNPKNPRDMNSPATRLTNSLKSRLCLLVTSVNRRQDPRITKAVLACSSP